MAKKFADLRGQMSEERRARNAEKTAALLAAKVKPTLLLDVDGVLTDHNAEHLRGLNARFGTNFKFSDITDFGYSFLTPKQRSFMWMQWRNASYEDKLLTPEQEHALAEVRELVRVVACSSPMAGHIASKYDFLLRYFDRTDIILASDKALVRGDILVDDGPHNIESFPAHVIVFYQPWNRHLTAHTRISSLSELPIHLRSLFTSLA